MINKVKQLRTEKNITQKQLSILTCLGQSTISNIETDRYTPRVDVAMIIAQALGTTVEKLFIIDSKI